MQLFHNTISQRPIISNDLIVITLLHVLLFNPIMEHKIILRDNSNNNDKYFATQLQAFIQMHNGISTIKLTSRIKEPNYIFI